MLSFLINNFYVICYTMIFICVVFAYILFLLLRIQILEKERHDLTKIINILLKELEKKEGGNINEN